MKFYVDAKITSTESINSPLEIEAETEKQALEIAEKINEEASDIIHHQKLILDGCFTEFSINKDEYRHSVFPWDEIKVRINLEDL